MGGKEGTVEEKMNCVFNTLMAFADIRRGIKKVVVMFVASQRT